MSHAPYGRRSGNVYRFGSTQLKRVGVKSWYWSDLYHWMLALSWPQFFLFIGIGYLLTNLAFAAVYFAVPGSVANARPDSFIDVFFFSIETMATVGYGFMNPGTLFGHLVASCEILLGMLEVAVVTGLMFARFSRPTSRIMFSKVAVVSNYNGTPTLMIRTGNERNNLIFDAAVRAFIVRREPTLEGQEFTHIYDLELERQTTSVFALSWTVMHRIDESSPLFGKTTADLQAEGSTLTVSISGMDDTLHENVHARHSYGPEDLHFGQRFADIFSAPVGDVRIIDFHKFHDTVPDPTWQAQ